MSAPLPDRPRLPVGSTGTLQLLPDGDSRERLVCARCEFIHYQNRRSLRRRLRGTTTDMKILLAKRAIEPRKGFWTLPAGYMELGETTEQAAQREARPKGLRIDRRSTGCWPCAARIGQVRIMSGQAHERRRRARHRAKKWRWSTGAMCLGISSLSRPWCGLSRISTEVARQDGFRDILQSDGRSRPHVAATQTRRRLGSASSLEGIVVAIPAQRLSKEHHGKRRPMSGKLRNILLAIRCRSSTPHHFVDGRQQKKKSAHANVSVDSPAASAGTPRRTAAAAGGGTGRPPPG